MTGDLYRYDEVADRLKAIGCRKNKEVLSSVSPHHYSQLELDLYNGRDAVLINGEVFSVAGKDPSHSMTFLRQTLLTSAYAIMNETAVQYGYTNIAEAVSFAGDKYDIQFRVEGNSFLRWRTLVRRACFDLAETLYRDNLVIPRTHQLRLHLPPFELLNENE